MDTTVASALSHINPEDRDVWIRVGMAIRSEFGDSGFEVWDDWSAQAQSYRPRDARSAWRSFSGGGVGIGTLFFLAQEGGWRRETPSLPYRSRKVSKATIRDVAADHDAARLTAQEWLCEAVLGTHPYLASKGFPAERGLVFEGDLLVPMRDQRTNQLNSLQRIKSDGSKRFLKGGKASGSVFAMGSGTETYLCEGYATALSIRAALAALYRQARVVVCFSAHNLPKAPGSYVIADNDKSETGKRYAEKTGLPWWMPPEVGTDANDFHRAHGVQALANAIRDLRRQA